MLNDHELRQIRPFIATPSHTGTLTSVYVRSLLGLVNAAWAKGLSMQTRFLDGDSLIPRARNRLVAEFMADRRWTHLFWIDADVGFEPEAALRLMAANRAVVAGVYPHKTDAWPAEGLRDPLPVGSTRADLEARHASYPFNPITTPPATIDADGFLPALDAPTGFMLIARPVFERLAAAMPELSYQPEPGPHSLAELPHYRFFDTLFEPETGRYLSEDFAFCRRWQAVGGQVFVDMHSRLMHQGVKTWCGDLPASLSARATQQGLTP